MTVLNTTNKIRENGNGALVNFDFPFKIFQEEDLEVYKVNKTTGVATLQTITTDYTVAISTTTEGGTVTYVVAPTSNEESFIVRVIDLTQPADIPTESNLPEEQLENAYDRSRMIDQQLTEQISRAVLFSTTSDSTDVTIPEPDSDKILGWNNAGDNLENKDAATSTISIPSITGNSEKVLSVNTGETAFEYIQNTLRNADISIKTDNYLLTATDKGKIMTMNSGVAKAFTFPDIVGNEISMIKNMGAGTLTLTPDGSDTIEQATLEQDESVILVGDGTNNKWRIVASDITATTTDEKVKVFFDDTTAG
jgi:hypothetical protein